jgi:hypothetical protein
MSTSDYQHAQVGMSFMCAGLAHDRCPGSTVDQLWKRWACTCDCHGESPDGPPKVCEHRMKVPHFLGDGSGRMRWTCGDCHADLWMDWS